VLELDVLEPLDDEPQPAMTIVNATSTRDMVHLRPQA